MEPTNRKIQALVDMFLIQELLCLKCKENMYGEQHKQET